MSTTSKTKSSTPRYCGNCHHRLSPHAKYCNYCSQRYEGGKISVREFFSEFFEAIFNVDSAIFRSLTHIWIPGKLTNDFFVGRRKRYVHPLRLFLTAGFLCFAIFGYLLLSSLGEQMDGINKISERNAYAADYHTQIEQLRDSVLQEVDYDVKAATAIDSMLEWTSHGMTDSFSLWIPNWERLEVSSTFKVDRRDLYLISPDSLLNRLSIDHPVDRYVARQEIRILTSDISSLVRYALGNLIWLMAVMVVGMALTLKLLYIRRKRYFIEHLIFSLHLHTFLLILVIVEVLLYWMTGDLYFDEKFTFEPTLTSLGITIYSLVALKRVYQQNWKKTILKFLIIVLIALPLWLIIAVSLSLLAGLALY